MMIQSQLFQTIKNLKFHFGSNDLSFDPSVEFQKSKPEWTQVHGIQSVFVQNIGQKCGETDGLYTSHINVPIGIITADCVPVLMCRKDGSQISTIHSGWRGTHAQIIKNFFTTTKEDPKKWLCVLGPSIKWCCYEVSDELISKFKEKFKGIDPNIYIQNSRYLDLQNLIENEWLSQGLDIEKIELCTFCSKNKSGAFMLSSYRRDKNNKRQTSTLQLIS